MDRRQPIEPAFNPTRTEQSPAWPTNETDLGDGVVGEQNSGSHDDLPGGFQGSLDTKSPLERNEQEAEELAEGLEDGSIPLEEAETANTPADDEIVPDRRKKMRKKILAATATVAVAAAGVFGVGIAKRSGSDQSSPSPAVPVASATPNPGETATEPTPEVLTPETFEFTLSNGEKVKGMEAFKESVEIDATKFLTVEDAAIQGVKIISLLGQQGISKEDQTKIATYVGKDGAHGAEAFDKEVLEPIDFKAIGITGVEAALPDRKDQADTSVKGPEQLPSFIASNRKGGREGHPVTIVAKPGSTMILGEGDTSSLPLPPREQGVTSNTYHTMQKVEVTQDGYTFEQTWEMTWLRYRNEAGKDIWGLGYFDGYPDQVQPR